MKTLFLLAVIIHTSSFHAHLKGQSYAITDINSNNTHGYVDMAGSFEKKSAASTVHLSVGPGWNLVRAFDASSTRLDSKSDSDRSIWESTDGNPFFFSNRGGSPATAGPAWIAGSPTDASRVNNIGEREQVVLGQATNHKNESETALLVGIRRRRGTGDPVLFSDRAPGELSTFHNSGSWRLEEGVHWSADGPKAGEFPAFRAPAIFTWRSQYVPYDMFDGTYGTGPQGIRPKYPGIRRPEWFMFQIHNLQKVSVWGPYEVRDNLTPNASGTEAERPHPDNVPEGYTYRRTNDGLVSQRYNLPFSIEFDNNENGWSYTRLQDGDVMARIYSNIHLQAMQDPPGTAEKFFQVSSQRYQEVNLGPPGSFVEWALIWENGPALVDKKVVYAKRSVNDLIENGGNGKWKAYWGYSLDQWGTNIDSPSWDAWFAERSDWLERIVPGFAGPHFSKAGNIKPNNTQGYKAVAGKTPGEIFAEIWDKTSIGLSSRVSGGVSVSTWIFNAQWHQGSGLSPDPFSPYNETVPVAAVFDAYDAAVSRANVNGTDADGNPVYATTTPLSAVSPWIGMSHAALYYPGGDSRLPQSSVGNPLKTAMSIYPNPVKDVMYIVDVPQTGKPVILSIMDIKGQLVFSAEISGTSGSNTVKLELSNLSDGFYFLKLDGLDGKAVRFVKK
jgi:hypothetical protein